eukprot:3037758-Amphidinium_carterae.1
MSLAAPLSVAKLEHKHHSELGRLWHTAKAAKCGTRRFTERAIAMAECWRRCSLLTFCWLGLQQQGASIAGGLGTRRVA